MCKLINSIVNHFRELKREEKRVLFGGVTENRFTENKWVCTSTMQAMSEQQRAVAASIPLNLNQLK